VFEFRGNRFGAVAALMALVVSGTNHAEVIDGEELRDPTMPFGASVVVDVAAPVAAPRYAVDFIRAGGETPVAVVNGQRVTVGELVEGSLVLAITREHVTLLIGNSEVDVRLNDSLVGSPVGDQPRQEQVP
jgi:hypothetical protein